ncbi:MAG TPA: amino acid racemase [Ignavibacteriaceae bacterium]|nr:amino acid racemase [Ignavibacteriaceae bacterium]
MNNKPLLGIIGGMGTAAGLHFQKLFFDVCNKNGIKGDDNYPEWIYFNASKAPDRTDAILNNGDSPVGYLVEVIKKLEKAGVDLIVITCNTAHAFYDEIINQTKIPWIDLQKETAKLIKTAGYSSVALLSTEGTLKSGVFRKAIKPIGINYFEPGIDLEIQKKITDAIYNPIYGIKNTGSKISSEAKNILQEVIDKLETEAIIAGCTELSLAEKELILKADWLDPMKITADACFTHISSKL